MSGFWVGWGAGMVVDYFLQLCGDAPSARDFASPKQRGLVGWWAREVEEGVAEDTVVGLVAAVFSLSPLSLDPFQGL